MKTSTTPGFWTSYRKLPPEIKGRTRTVFMLQYRFIVLLPMAASVLFYWSRITPALGGSLEPDRGRVDQIAEMLQPEPQGVGPRIEDRSTWDAAARLPAFQQVVTKAGWLLKAPMPEITDDLFLDYSRTGNRNRAQKVIGQRHGRIRTLVLAECLENRGRFLPAIEEAILAVCSEKTWVLPAHDRKLRNFHGTLVDIDLVSSAVAWELATARHWLAERLTPPVRQRIQDELQRRILTPYESSLKTGKPRLGWVTSTNNWNAVCLAGVTGTALAEIASADRRAWHLGAAEKHIQSLMRGYTDAGYCSEGLGYWNYGFGHFILLAETMRRATDGKLDLFEVDKARQVARFGRRMEIIPGVYPALADCRLNARPNIGLMALLSRQYQFGWTPIERQGFAPAARTSGALFRIGLFGSGEPALRSSSAVGKTPAQPPRDWFPEAQVLICRPHNSTDRALGVAIKGGHNAEHHNHNDVGTFVVALDGQTPLVDPGSEVYTRRTFSPMRYESDVLNSFGHPVPLIAGKKQRSGLKAAATVAKIDLTDSLDQIDLDLTAAYNVPELKSARRRFLFSRAGRGHLTVVDRVEFDSPQSYGVALITLSEPRSAGPNRWLVGKETCSVEITLETEGRKVVFTPQRLESDLPGKQTVWRLGFDLKQPVKKGVLRTTIVPEGG